ncbi:MAG TPA: hypothetical protein VFJ29_05315 [Candidatus Kapabacteria bacterium]|nr:hypothetical protein [Candidatus Kapabacteria bacterium]
MIAFKQHIAGFLAAMFLLASLGTPITIYRCSVNGRHQTVNCCPEKAHETYGGTIRALPCMSALYAAPMKANVTPTSHKTFSAHIAVLCSIAGERVFAPSLRADSYGQNANEYLPPPLLRSTVLLV